MLCALETDLAYSPHGVVSNVLKTISFEIATKNEP